MPSAQERNDTESELSLLAMGRLRANQDRKSRRVAATANSLSPWIIGVGAIAFYLWASSAEFDQVTRAPGSIIVAQQTKMIQHLEGGIISQIFVEEGQKVIAGAPLLQIRDRRWIASRAQALVELKARRATRARLLAEAQGADVLTFDGYLAGDASALSEAALFESRREGLKAKSNVLGEQIKRLLLELAELTERKKNIQAERELLAERSRILANLVAKGAVPRTEELAMLTQLQQVDTRISDLKFRIPQTNAQLKEKRNELQEEEIKFKTEARDALAKVELEIAKLQEDVARFDERQTRSIVRSPVDGVVNRLFVSTVDGVVKDGQTIAEIVPSGNDIVVDARLRPEDRGSVWPGMSGLLKVTAYDFGLYGGVEAEVAEISADALRDENGMSYFRVRLSASASSLGAERPLLPGMSVEVDLLSGSRTFLEYLLSPVATVRSEAFQE